MPTARRQVGHALVPRTCPISRSLNDHMRLLNVHVHLILLLVVRGRIRRRYNGHRQNTASVLSAFSLFHSFTYACFAWKVIIELSDNELAALGFLGPGECLFVCVHVYPLFLSLRL
jgi:hypothetical protein